MASAFSPQNFKVNLGDTVTLVVSNRDMVAPDEPYSASAHPIRLSAPDGAVVGELHLILGETESITFGAEQVGDYIFRCVNRNCLAHLYMTSFFGTNGVIAVVA